MRRKLWWILGLVGVTVTLGMSLLLHTLSSVSVMATVYPHLESNRSALLEGYKLVKGVPFFKETGGRLVQGKTTDRERLEALVAWTHENVRPNYAAPDDVMQGNFYDIALRGFGYCDQLQHVFLTLAHYVGYEGRMIQLRRVDGSSPHSVSEVRVGDRWILADPWLMGIVLHDGAGNMLTIADLERRPELLDQLGYDGSLRLRVSNFANSTIFRTFPYQDFWASAEKIRNRIRHLPVFPPLALALRSQPASVPLATAYAPSQTPINGRVLTRLVALYDAARRAHLNGRYTEAVGHYEKILESGTDERIADSTRFFLGLALLRAGQATEALSAFNRALTERPNTRWRSSILYYRAEAREAVGDSDGAMADLQTADIAPARLRLRELRSNAVPRAPTTWHERRLGSFGNRRAMPAQEGLRHMQEDLL